MKLFLADQEHDAMLRSMMRSAVMPGHIRIAYEREPDFFQGLGILGTFNQIIAAVESNQMAIMGCRSIRPMFINGEEIDFGYLSGLRSTLPAKQRLGLVRGYRMLKELHGDGRCPGYISTIIEGNAAAFSTLARGRAGLPSYIDMGECCTYAIALNKHASMPRTSLSPRFARPGEEALVFDLLKRFGKCHQFFPVLSGNDSGTPLLLNLPITSFLIAEQNGTPCGIIAIWDQSAFKQHRIAAYSRLIRRIKPLLNAGLKTAGFSPLPREGEILNTAFICFKAVQHNDPEIMELLVRHACTHLQRAGFSHAIIGFHNDDPARPCISPFISTLYRSRLFFVGWEDDLKTFNRLDGRTPYFDPAIL